MASTKMRIIGWLLVAVQFTLFGVLFVLPRRPVTTLTAVMGAVIVGVGLIVVVAAFIRLGNALTPTPVPLAHAGLRTTGIYRIVRHPIYSGILLIAIGIVVAIGSWWTVAWLITLIIFFTLKYTWEDRLLRETYGSPWVQWAEQTGALIPRI